jgi:NSS family neurotransmitter:Na+ symporter
MARQSTMEELGMGDGFFYRLWRIVIRYITPVAVVVVFLQVIGVLDWVWGHIGPFFTSG